MQDFESETDRVERVDRMLDSFIKRVRKGEKPAPLREHLEVALMMSPITGTTQTEMLSRFDEATDAARLHRNDPDED